MKTSALLGDDDSEGLQTLGGGEAISNAGSLNRGSFLLKPHIQVANLFAKATGGTALSNVAFSYDNISHESTGGDSGTGGDGGGDGGGVGSGL